MYLNFVLFSLLILNVCVFGVSVPSNSGNETYEKKKKKKKKKKKFFKKIKKKKAAKEKFVQKKKKKKKKNIEIVPISEYNISSL